MQPIDISILLVDGSAAEGIWSLLCFAWQTLHWPAFTWCMRRAQVIDAKFATANFRGPLWYWKCHEVFAIINDVFFLTEVAFRFNGSRARRWPLNIWLRFCLDLLRGSEASPCDMFENLSCLSDGSSLPVKKVRHSRNVSESSLKVRKRTRRSSQCIVERFNAWRVCKCFVALSESFLKLHFPLSWSANRIWHWREFEQSRACCHRSLRIDHATS